MYMDDHHTALGDLASHLNQGGLLSVTFRNRAALAFRPGLRQDWSGALAAFDASTYVNELGLRARAHELDEVTAYLDEFGLSRTAWYGVRVFTDAAEADAQLPADDLACLLDAEFEAGRRDPYRQLASQIHLIAQRRG